MSSQLSLGSAGHPHALQRARWVADRIERLGWEVALVIADIPDRSSIDSSLLKRIFQEQRITALVLEMSVLPVQLPEELAIAAIPVRFDPRDVLVSRDMQRKRSPDLGAVIGVTSPLRRLQLHTLYPRCTIVDLTGDPTAHLPDLASGHFDALCLSASDMDIAGQVHLEITYLDPLLVTPVGGQGALALLARADDAPLLDELSILTHDDTAAAIAAERATLHHLPATGLIPGVLAEANDEEIRIFAVLGDAATTKLIREELCGQGDPVAIGRALGLRLAERVTNPENPNALLIDTWESKG